MKRIMIVDDNEAVLDMVSELISSIGYQPLTASGGRACLEKLESDLPDLMLLDINMPDLDGWSVLREMKDRGITDQVKVMMLTATTDVGTDIFGLQDVVSGYIRKPFNNKDLASRITEALEGEQESEEEHEVKEEPQEERVGLFSRLFGKGRPRNFADHGKEEPKDSAMRFDLRKGFGYIVKERKPNRSFEIFVDQVTHNIQGLCVTRQHPNTIRTEWGLEKTPIIWLSNKLGKVYVNPTNIGILSDTIVRFVEKSEDSIVLIDGVEFLVVNNDFEKVLRMIHHVTEAVMENKSRMILSVDPRALDIREMALLERNMEIIDTMEDGEGSMKETGIDGR
ncbi:MAG: DUF835 domain-containing protein [Thermoplasmatota archaeon]